MKNWIDLYTPEMERLSELYKLKLNGAELSDNELEEYEQLVDEIGMFLPVTTG